MRKLRIIDLFAGCGGLSDGFEQTGLFTTIACVEWEQAPCATFVNRLRDKWGYTDAARRVLRFDIQRTEELLHGWTDDPVYGTSCGLSELASGYSGIDMIIGGPPCQAYSMAGRIRDKYGMNYDYRNYLFESYLEVVKFFSPPIIVFENVPGMLSAAPGGIVIIDRIRDKFQKAGYELIFQLKDKALLDFVSFGIPQKRSRLILVGLKRSVFGSACQKNLLYFYENILSEYKSSRIRTVYNAIGDLPPMYPAESDYRIDNRKFSHKFTKHTVPNHIPRYHNNRDIQIFRELAADIEAGTYRYTSIKAIHKLYTQKTGKKSNVHKYYVLRWDEPSNTIPAHLYKDGLRHIHPDSKQARSITVREAARLQTFGDDFIFLGSLGDQYKMIGNAVPPVVGKIIAESLYKLLEKYTKPKGESYVGLKSLREEVISSGIRI